jgi:hypothetical protein
VVEDFALRVHVLPRRRLGIEGVCGNAGEVAQELGLAVGCDVPGRLWWLGDLTDVMGLYKAFLVARGLLG